MRANTGILTYLSRAVAAPDPTLTGLERVLSLFAGIRSGEGRSAVLLAGNIFLLLLACYLLKPVREALVLTEGSAEIKSLATAGQALALMALIPAYAAWSRGKNRLRLVQGVALFFASHLGVFAALGSAGVSVGVAFFIWQGVFNLFVVAQFWAFAAELYRVESGQRLFAIIMAGASLGALAGAQISGKLAGPLGPWGLMLLAGAVLLTTLGLMAKAAKCVPVGSARTSGKASATVEDRTCGFRAVISDTYLRLIALFVVLLNMIQTTGVYVLDKLVLDYANREVQLGSALGREEIIGAFFADFYSWMCVLNIAVQLLLVSRIIRTAGVAGALLIVPLLAAAGFGLIAFVPIFTVVAVVQLTGNSLNYSVQNTARQALFLPVDGTARFQGKTAIETFFWRFGDLLQAGVVYAGYYLLDFQVTHFALVNTLLAVAWLAVAVLIGRHYRQLVQNEASS